MDRPTSSSIMDVMQNRGLKRRFLGNHAAVPLPDWGTEPLARWGLMKPGKGERERQREDGVAPHENGRADHGFAGETSHATLFIHTRMHSRWVFGPSWVVVRFHRGRTCCRPLEHSWLADLQNHGAIRGGGSAKALLAWPSGATRLQGPQQGP